MKLFLNYFNKYSIYICTILLITIIILIYFYLNKECTNKCICNEINSISKEEKLNEEENYYYVDIKGEVINNGVYKINSGKRIIDVIDMAGGLTNNADTTFLNLSKKITDEMFIKIYSKEEVNNAKKNLNKENVCEPVIIEKECEKETIEVIKEVEKECEKETIEIIKEIEKECICTNDASIIDNKELKTNTNAVDDINEYSKLVNINTATIDELITISGIGEAKAKSIIEYRNNTKFNTIEDIMNVSGIGDSLFEKIKNYITV